MGGVCSFQIAFKMAPWLYHGVILSVCVCVIVLVSSHRQHGVRLGSVSELTVISVVTVEIVANSRVELTDVKIYLEANHAANRGTGTPATQTA